MVGRTKGAKDKSPRIRRTRQQIEADKLALTPNVAPDPAQTESKIPTAEIGGTETNQEGAPK